MNDTVYFLYIDEIFTPTLTEFLKRTKEEIETRKHHHHFGLSGIIMPANKMVETNFSCRRLQNKYYSGKEHPIFHYREILHSIDMFSDLHNNPKKKQSLVSALNYWIGTTEFQCMYSFVNKEQFILKHGTFYNQKLTRIKKIRGNIQPALPIKGYNLYPLVLKYLLINFYDFLTRKSHPARGFIVAESRGTSEDASLRNAFDAIHRGGISSISVSEFRSRIVELFVVNKKLNHAPLQLSDLLLYPTYDAVVPDHKPREDHFIDYDKTIKSKLYKNSIKIFP